MAVGVAVGVGVIMSISTAKLQFGVGVGVGVAVGVGVTDVLTSIRNSQLGVVVGVGVGVGGSADHVTVSVATLSHSPDVAVIINEFAVSLSTITISPDKRSDFVQVFGVTVDPPGSIIEKVVELSILLDISITDIVIS